MVYIWFIGDMTIWFIGDISIVNGIITLSGAPAYVDLYARERRTPMKWMTIRHVHTCPG
jgi:hypothetical protein